MARRPLQYPDIIDALDQEIRSTSSPRQRRRPIY
jgi:hypothetical protein